MSSSDWRSDSDTAFGIRDEELMAATVAATLLRDAARAVDHTSDNANLAGVWAEQQVALLRLITPTDYELLSQAVEGGHRRQGACLGP